MKKTLLFSFIHLFFSSLAFSQQYLTLKDAPEKAKESYKLASQYLIANDIDKGQKELEKIIKKYPTFVHPYWLLADCWRQKKDLDKSLSFFQKAIDLAPDLEPRVYFNMADICMAKKDYNQAATHFDKFLSYSGINEDLKIKAQKNAADARFRPQALANPVAYTPQNLGSNVNSNGREYFPSITADENVLVYTVQKDVSMNGQEDLYMSHRVDGAWQKSISIAAVNTNENEAAQSISADGKLLVFTVCNRQGDYGSCDLYLSERVNGEWTKPRNIGAPINTAAWESQPSVAPNGDAIYFTRGGARGQGTRDLYVSYRRGDQWSNPEPVKELNTPFNEAAPCLHPDGQTLYFSSDGHAGMGGYDLFISHRTTDGSWGKPVNMGYPINTEGMEEAVAVSLTGNLAFIASDRSGGLGSLDIYSFELPSALRPNPVTYAKARVIDANTKKTISLASVEIVDLQTQQVFALVNTDRDGEFLICMPRGKSYALNVNKDKYLFHSENFALDDLHSHDQPFLLTIALQPIPTANTNKPTNTIVSEPIILKNVFFATASAKLEPQSKTELDKLKKFLMDNPSLRIRLNGHTDDRGDDNDNLTLSDNRAKAVRDYLIENGIDANRLEYKGFGEKSPITTNESPEGRAQNRRTEFVILSNGN